MNSSAVTDRRLDRLSATIPISVLLSRENYQAEFDAYTVDVSHRGIRLRTNFALFPGDMLGIAQGDEPNTSIPSRVVWVQRTSVGGSLAGLEFLTGLPV
jgi:hypothetical protein